MQTLYLDMNIYNRPFDDQNEVRIRLETIAVFSILQKIKNGDFILLWSFMIEYENSLNPFDDVKLEIYMASSLANKVITHNEEIYNVAKKFEPKGIKPRDALHLACALRGKADFFITCDDKIIKKASALGISLKVRNPIRFIEEMEES